MLDLAKQAVQPNQPTVGRFGPGSLLVVGLLAVPPLIFWLLLRTPEVDLLFEEHWFHFQIVSFTSLVAFVLGLLVTYLTGPVADARTLFVTLALSAIGGIFLIHGLATPGIFIPGPNPAVQWSSIFSLLAGAVLFAAAGHPWTPAQAQWIVGHRHRIWKVAAGLYLLYAVVAFSAPAPLALLTTLRPASANLVAGVACFLYALAAWRFWKMYRQSGQRSAAVLSVSFVLLAEAVCSLRFGPLWQLSWWLYHVLMLVAFILTLGVVTREYERVRHFHLTAYFAAIGVIGLALLALSASALVGGVLGEEMQHEGMHAAQLRIGMLVAGGAALLFLLLFGLVRRGGVLLAQHALALRQQEVALERGRMAEALLPIGLAIGTSLELDEVLETICETSLQLFGVDSALLWLRQGDELVGRAARGYRSEAFVGVRRSLFDPSFLAGEVVRRGQPLIVNHALHGEQNQQKIVMDVDIRALLGVPLLEHGEARGALILVDIGRDDRFTPLDLEVATLFGQQAAMALTRSRLYEQIQEQSEALAVALQDVRSSYQTTLTALGAALDARDHETEGHSRRVTRYALRLAEAIGLTSESYEALELGALLHDLGKIGVPDAILHKPGALDPEEWRLMRRHPEIGHAILRDIPFLHKALAVVRHHHERWDGRGYPLGLGQQDIPLAARIFAVADTLDAITAIRPYRPTRSFGEAHAEILRQAGHQFDPAVVDAFASVPLREWEALARAEVPAGRAVREEETQAVSIF